MQSLLSRINGFFKLAGILKYPPKMKKEIMYYLNYALNDNKYFDKDYFVKKIYIDLDGLPKNYKLPLLKGVAKMLGKYITLDISFYEKDEDIEDLGYFDENLLELKLNLVNNESYLEDIESTIEHELMHLVQYLLKQTTSYKINRFDDDEFLESEELKETHKYYESDQDNLQYLKNKYKIRNKIQLNDPNYLGLPSEYDKNKYIDLNKKQLPHHSQDPIEFFTDLNDTINNFIFIGATRDNFNKMINSEIGYESTKYFWKHIKYNEKLYNRAVKELWKVYQEKKID